MSCAGNSAWWIWGRIQTLMSNVWPKDGLLPSHAADRSPIFLTELGDCRETCKFTKSRTFWA